MNIIFFLGPFPAPSETFVINQIIGLIELKHDVNIICMRSEQSQNIHQQYTQYNLQSKTTNLSNASLILKLIIKLIKKKKKSHFIIAHLINLSLAFLKKLNRTCYKSDHIIAHFGNRGVIAHELIKLKILQGKLHTVFHGADVSRKKILKQYDQSYKELFESAEGILPISKLWKNKLLDLGCPVEKINVNRMGINVDNFTCRPFDQALTNPVRIISVGRLTEKKGFIDAISAVMHLKKQDIKFSYQIIGEGEEKEKIKEKIKELDLKNEVKLIGFQPQEKIKSLLSQSDIFLLPSITAVNGDMEGIPVALMEAMATGLITVSTKHSGIPELIQHEVSGFLAEENAPYELAGYLKRIINGNENISLLRKNARETICAKFNQQHLYTELVEILKKTK